MKKLEDNRLKLDVLQQTSEGFNKIKIATFSAVLTTYVCLGAMSSWASDLEIYKSGSDGSQNTTIQFLLDISGSMDTRSIETDFGTICSTKSGSTVFEGNNTSGKYCTASGSEITAQIKRDCTLSGATYQCYDRISRLKQGMLAVLQGDAQKGVAKLDDELYIGLSTLGAYYNNAYRDTGAVLVPARKLKDIVTGATTQRDLLVQKVNSLQGLTNTPTARSYAETIAYLMGTTTQGGGAIGSLSPNILYFPIDGTNVQVMIWPAPNIPL